MSSTSEQPFCESISPIILASVTGKLSGIFCRSLSSIHNHPQISEKKKQTVWKPTNRFLLILHWRWSQKLTVESPGVKTCLESTFRKCLTRNTIWRCSLPAMMFDCFYYLQIENRVKYISSPSEMGGATCETRMLLTKRIKCHIVNGSRIRIGHVPWRIAIDHRFDSPLECIDEYPEIKNKQTTKSDKSNV